MPIIGYLKGLIEWYLSNPDNALYSAEENSRGAFKPPVGDAHPDRYLTHPQSAWLRDGLRNGDQLVSVNGSGVETEGELNDLLNALHVGEQVKLDIIRVGKPHQITANAASYDWPDVTLRPIPAASQRQQAILAQWQASK